MRILESFSTYSVGLKCVRKSSTESLLNLSPLYTVVSKNVVSVSEISAVNLIVAWCLSACSMNLAISSLLIFHIEKNESSMNLFQTSGFVSLLLRISVSTFAMKMLAKATDILESIAVPWVCR